MSNKKNQKHKKDCIALIDELGGSMKVAIDLNLSQHAIEAWRKRGIPRKHWEYFQKHFMLNREQMFSICDRTRSNDE